MKKYLSFVLLLLAITVTLSNEAMGQRRARPGAMKHTEQEAVNAMKVKKVKTTCIRDGATFVGDIYMTGDAGAIKVGTATIVFTNGKYKLNFTHKKFKVQETTPSGIKYWTKQKLGKDFSYGGEYEVIEQNGNMWLKLYETTAADGNCDKYQINWKDDKSFDLEQDDMLMRMHYREY